MTLKYDLKMHLDRLAHKGEGVLREGLEKVTEGAYKSILGDIKEQAGERGIGLSFAKFDGSVFEQIAGQKWYGRNYSERVWRNLGKLEKRLETTLFEGLVKGDNTKLIARQLSQDMAVGMYEAKRLVRTETTYYTNQVARRGIVDAGLDKYEYLAAHDHRTSEICRELDGQVFELKDAQVGVNYPPMHPHCRSTVVAWFGEEEYLEKEKDLGYDINILKRDASPLRKSFSEVSPEDFTSLTEEFLKKGGTIDQSEEAQEYLDFRNADAVTFNSNLILLRPNPCYTELLEELYHTTQYERGVEFSGPGGMLFEIEAKEHVLTEIEKYPVPQIEIAEYKKNLEAYKKDLERWREENPWWY